MASPPEKHLQETDQGGAVAAPLPTTSNWTHQAGCSEVDTSLRPVQLQDRPPPVLSCMYCPEKFACGRSLRRHVKRHLIRCSLCDPQFPDEISFSVHTCKCMKPRHLPETKRKLDRIYKPYRQDIWSSPRDFGRSHRQTAGVNVATQEGTLAEARPSFSAEDMSGSRSSVVKPSKDSSRDMREFRATLSSLVKSLQDLSRDTGRGDLNEIIPVLSSLLKSLQDSSRGSGLGDMSAIIAALPAIPVALPQECSPMDLSRGGGLGDVSGIRAALPGIPTTSSQQSSSMELKETTSTGHIECINCPRKFAYWNQAVQHVYAEAHGFRVEINDWLFECKV